MLSAGGHERGGERAWTEAADRQTCRKGGGGGSAAAPSDLTTQHNNNDNTRGTRHSALDLCNYYHTHYYSGMNKL